MNSTWIVRETANRCILRLFQSKESAEHFVKQVCEGKMIGYEHFSEEQLMVDWFPIHA